MSLVAKLINQSGVSRVDSIGYTGFITFVEATLIRRQRYKGQDDVTDEHLIACSSALSHDAATVSFHLIKPSITYDSDRSAESR